MHFLKEYLASTPQRSLCLVVAHYTGRGLSNERHAELFALSDSACLNEIERLLNLMDGATLVRLYEDVVGSLIEVRDNFDNYRDLRLADLAHKATAANEK